jgi:predicted ATPase/class 3 adenylate cyclase
VAAQPRGTVTLLFSDIEGSTSLLEELGIERYESALELQRRAMREAIVAHDGFEVSCEADSFFVAFSSAAAAIEAAVAAQRALLGAEWPGGRQARVRMGVHTGEPRVVDSNYLGVDVHQAARIMDAAHGGQVLLSEATSGQIDGREVRDLGVHRLKDLSVPQRLFQLQDERLPTRFPPLRTADAYPTNLPKQLTPLLGRSGELAEIEQLVGDGVRLVTLVGTGGIGKTRLALEAARRLVKAFPDGVYLVELAQVVDATLIWGQVGAAIGLLDTRQEAVERYLRSKRVLIVVDNLEQLPGAGAECAKLLAIDADVCVVATSRAPLRVRGEQVYDVSPLANADAVALFVARAAAASPSFRSTDENVEAIAAICERLDGLPLAIELAATRVSLLEPRDLLGRLDSRLALLTTGAQDVPERHRALRAALVWSYDLLTAGQQELFARLGVFVGGFTIAAAESVAGASLDDLAALVDASLIRRRDGRFTMLETIRELSVERVQELGIETDLLERHAAFYERLALQGDNCGPTADPDVLGDPAQESENLRAALDWVTAEDPSGRRALAFACATPWELDLRDGHRRLESLLRTYTTPDADRLRGLVKRCWISANLDQLERVLVEAPEAVELATQLGDPRTLWDLWGNIRFAYAMRGDFEGMRDALDHVAEATDQLEDDEIWFGTHFMFLHFYVFSRDFESFDRLRPTVIDAARKLPDTDEALSYVDYLTSENALAQGRPREATAGFQHALRCSPPSDIWRTRISMEGIAISLAGGDDPLLGLRLGAAATAHYEACGIPSDHSPGSWNELRVRYYGEARRRVGDARADEAVASGRHLSLAEAAAMALEA